LHVRENNIKITSNVKKQGMVYLSVPHWLEILSNGELSRGVGGGGGEGGGEGGGRRPGEI
jgi:hypothetical protein